MQSRHLVILFVIFLLSNSCDKGISEYKTTTPKESNNHLTGVWLHTDGQLDNNTGNKLIITKNDVIIGIDTEKGNMIIFRDNLVNNSLILYDKKHIKLKQIAEDSIITIGRKSLEKDTFTESIVSENPSEEAILSIQGDSLRSKLLGEWVFIESESRLELPNSQQIFTGGSIRIEEDGIISFYPINNDIEVTYRYFMDGKGMTLRNGCILSKVTLIEFPKENFLKMHLEEKPLITNEILFERAG